MATSIGKVLRLDDELRVWIPFQNKLFVSRILRQVLDLITSDPPETVLGDGRSSYTFHRALDGYTFESFRLIKTFHEHPCWVSHSERRFARKVDLRLFRLSASDLTAKRPACINSAWSCFGRWIQRFADSREHKSECPSCSSKGDQAVLLHWVVPMI